LTGITAAVGLAFALLLGACGGSSGSADRGTGKADALAAKDVPVGPDGFSLTSVNFKDGAALPARFSCDATNISPSLTIGGVPDGTAELAIVVDDPGAADGTYVHWIIDLPAGSAGLAEDLVPDKSFSARNSAGRTSYSGACPPKGDPAHTYRFTVYALDEAIGKDIDDTDASDALSAIAEHATAKATLSATYQRKS
jgi:Raf kinase inhibitor-like YbhB/YbcL family protein